MIRLKLSALAAYLRGRPKKRQQDVIKVIQNFARTTALRVIQEEIQTSTPKPVDRGTYARGWEAVTTETGAVVFNAVPYASVIERGRRPGTRPPIDVLAAWVLRKGLVRGGVNRAATARGIAFAIANKMAREGMPGRHVLQRAARRFLPELRDEIAKIGTEAR